MKTCKGCKYAEWRKTAAERLHPGGSGWCKFPVDREPPKVPAAFYWLSRPSLCGGHIDRHKEHRDHCAFYQPEKS